MNIWLQKYDNDVCYKEVYSTLETETTRPSPPPPDNAKQDGKPPVFMYIYHKDKVLLNIDFW